MKLRVISLVTAVMLLASQTVFADSIYLKFSGKTEADAKGATILVLDKNADVNNVTASDIVYVNQSSISQDGSFAMLIPFFIEEDYIIRSNALEFELNEPVKDKILYVSESGDDSNTGESADAPLKTLAKAYEQIIELKEVKISGTVTYTDVPESYQGGLKISGADETATLSVPSEISLKGDLTLSNIAISGGTTFYANGKHLKIEETVTSTTSLTAYGACKTEELKGDTNLEILGGQFSFIYGGGLASVNGNTNVTVGGKVNEGSEIKASNLVYAFVYGGGNNASVNGTTNVTFGGAAVSRYVFGAGSGENGTANATNVTIAGGKVMNVYGGAQKAVLTDCTTNVTVTGGLCEAVFGGSENVAMTGHANVSLLGGQVSRRVYSGCYNGTDTLSSNMRVVTGTTTLRIGPDVSLNTKTDLEETNDIGVRAGSRRSASNSAEKNTLIYLDDSYSAQNGKVGSKEIQGTLLGLSSHADLTVKAGINGDVTGTGTHGVIRVIPDNGYNGNVNGTVYTSPSDVTISGTTTVTFTKSNFSVNVNNAGATESGASANVNVTADNSVGEVTPKLIVALYDDVTGKLVDCSVVDATTEADKTVNFTGDLLADRTYTVKATIWNGKLKPLTAISKISFTK